jgi:hypothetical protein
MGWREYSSPSFGIFCLKLLKLSNLNALNDIGVGPLFAIDIPGEMDDVVRTGIIA